VLAKVGEEVAALQASAAAAAAAATEAGGEEGSAGPGASELLKPARESAAVLKEVWNPMVSKACGQGKLLCAIFVCEQSKFCLLCVYGGGYCGDFPGLWYRQCIFADVHYYVLLFAGLTALRGYLLPPPAPVLNLFYALGCLLGYAPAQLQNVCGDPDWDTIQQVGLFVACGRVVV
jgi:hypothetical protein